MSAPTLFNPERPATPAVAGPRPAPYVIQLPAGIELLNSNQRRHRHEQARIIAHLRETASDVVSESPSLMAALAAAKPGPLFQRAHILGVLHPASKTRCDPANWYPSFKACVDGLVDAGLFEDDDHTRVVGPDMRLGRIVKGAQLALVVAGLEPGEDPLGYRVVTR